MMSTVIVLTLVLVPWLICMWALVMTIVTAAFNERERFSLERLFSGLYMFELYNRKYLWAFMSALAFAMGVVIVVNVLFFTGRISLGPIRP